MVNLKNRLVDQIKAFVRRLIKFEICEVDKVHWHKTPGDKDYNLCDVVIRDRRIKGLGELPYAKATVGNDFYLRYRLPSLQHFIGKYTGSPWNPRRGNLVKVLFYKQRKGLILSPILSKCEPPICRPNPYTMRTKWTQYRPVPQDKNLDFCTTPDQKGKIQFPDPKKPKCENWWHGPCKGDRTDGEPTIGRDYSMIYDYCHEGDEDPSCKDCLTIDYPKRDENTWFKVYSHDTESCISPPKRLEYHTCCGSYLRFENETGKSVEYSEGLGHIRLGNAISEDLKKGHVNWHPTGSIDLHTVQEETEQQQASYGSTGKQIIAVSGPTHQVLDEGSNQVACRMIHFDKRSYIEILEDGRIIIKSGSASATITLDGDNNTITMTGTENIILNADTKIEINAPYVETNGDYWCFKHTKIYHGDQQHKIHCRCGEQDCAMCNPPPEE